MIKIIILIISGAMLGYIFKYKTILIASVDKITEWVIYLLLFFLGISVGLNDQIIKNFTTIGLHSIILTLCGITGSIFLSYITYLLFFKGKDLK